MRTHIAKSINTRCKAIENAVKAYNIAAHAIDPPCPTLDWTTASHYNFLEDFELLRDTRQDIHTKPWAQPVARVTIKQAQQIQCAQEEIENCNVEVQQLHTHILDEDHDFSRIIADLRAQGDSILGAVNDYCTCRRRVNAELLIRIFQIYALNGFSGTPSRGHQVGRVHDPIELDSTIAANRAADSDSDEGDLDDEDEACREYGGLVDYISDMPLRE